MRRIRICVVHRDSLLTEGIAKMIRGEEGLEVSVVMAGDEGILEQVGALRPDIILMDRNDSRALSILQSHQIHEKVLSPRLFILDLNSDRIRVHQQEEEVVTGKDGLIAALYRYGQAGHKVTEEVHRDSLCEA